MTAPALLFDTSQPGLEGASVGVAVREMGDPSAPAVYGLNADQLLMPASNVKVLTCMYALARLDPQYRGETRVWHLAGPPEVIYIDAPGDPSLTLAQLADLRSKLAGLCVTSSVSAVVRQAYAPGRNPLWEIGDAPSSYCTAVTALSVDGGVFELCADASGRVVEPPAYTGVTMEREPPGPAAGQQPPRVVAYDPFVRLLRVADGAATGARRVSVARLPLPAPDEAACAALGFRYGGPAPPGGPPSELPDALLRGATVAECIRHCLVTSNNGYAEHLLNMAARANGDSESVSPESILRDWAVTFLGLPPWSLKLVDGFGSRHSLATAGALCKALVVAPPLLRSLLPGPGEGTLAGRLEGLDFRGKTGTLDGAVSLSGYLKARSGRELAVSVVINNAPAPVAAVRAIIDRFVALCADVC